MNMIGGVDISAAQGPNVDFNWIKQMGYEFAIIKNYTGNDKKDPFYETNLIKAKNAGMYVGAYFFIYPLPSDGVHPNRDPISQANLHFSAFANDVPAEVDVEWPTIDIWSKYGCSATQINDWVLSYLERFEQLSGQKMLFYTYPSYANSVKFSSQAANYKLWIANYKTNEPNIPAPWTDYYMWQYAGNNSILILPSGGEVDTNYVKDFSMWDNFPSARPASTVVATTPQITDIPPPAPAPIETPIISTATTALSPNSATNELTTIENIIGIIVKIVKALFHIS